MLTMLNSPLDNLDVVLFVVSSVAPLLSSFEGLQYKIITLNYNVNSARHFLVMSNFVERLQTETEESSNYKAQAEVGDLRSANAFDLKSGPRKQKLYSTIF